MMELATRLKEVCHDRTVAVSWGSTAINAFIGSGKLILGLAVRSPWFIATAVYYLILCAARSAVLHGYRKAGAHDFAQQEKIYRRCGELVCLLGISYFFVCLRMYRWGDHSEYPFYILYGVAAVAFYKVSMAIYGVVVTRRRREPVLSALKILCLMDACVSIVAVQCALLTMQRSPQATTSSAFLGMGCSAVFLMTGIMIRHKKRGISNESSDL